MRLSKILFAAGLALSLAAVAPAQSASNNGRTGGGNRQGGGTREGGGSRQGGGTRDHESGRQGERPVPPVKTPAEVPTPVAPPAPLIVPKAGPPSGGLGAVVNPNPAVGGGLIATALGLLAGLAFRRRRTAA